MISIIFLPLYLLFLATFIYSYFSIMHRRINEIVKKEVQNDEPPFKSLTITIVFPVIILYICLCFFMWLFKI